MVVAPARSGEVAREAAPRSLRGSLRGSRADCQRVVRIGGNQPSGIGCGPKTLEPRVGLEPTSPDYKSVALPT